MPCGSGVLATALLAPSLLKRGDGVLFVVPPRDHMLISQNLPAGFMISCSLWM